MLGEGLWKTPISKLLPSYILIGKCTPLSSRPITQSGNWDTLVVTRMPQTQLHIPPQVLGPIAERQVGAKPTCPISWPLSSPSPSIDRAPWGQAYP